MMGLKRYKTVLVARRHRAPVDSFRPCEYFNGRLFSFLKNKGLIFSFPQNKQKSLVGFTASAVAARRPVRIILCLCVLCSTGIIARGEIIIIITNVLYYILNKT